MKNKILFVLVIMISFSNLYSQNDSTEYQLENIKNIYNNLEFNTKSFDLIKEKWIIIDQNLIRNVFNQFLVKNELKLKDKYLSPAYVKLFSEAITSGKIYAKVTKRYFDDEVERFSFAIKENSDSLVEKLKLYVDYSSGNIDPVQYTTVVKNSLTSNNINISPLTSINDKSLIEKIFNTLFRNQLLKVDNNVINNTFAKIILKEISKNNVQIDVDYGNNTKSIKSLIFKVNSSKQIMSKLVYEGTQYLPDPITDCIYLRYIIGDDIYNAVKNKESHIEVSKEEFITDESYNFDINLNFFNPELMFWQSTTENVNKYLFSAFGKWGNDKTVVPGWFSSDYIGGVKLSYSKNINNPTDSSYFIAIGSSFKGGHPFPNQLAEKITFFSGRSIYFGLEGNPFNSSDAKIFKNLKLNMEGKIRLEKYTYEDWSSQETPYRIKDDFFTVKNYFNFEIKKYNIYDLNLFGLLNIGKLEAGLGYSLLDVQHLDIDRIDRSIIETSLEKGNQQNALFLDLGVVQREGLFQHGVTTILNYDFTGKYGYITLKIMAMLNNTFGLDLRFSRGFVTSGNNIPNWRNESYFIFSPIIRINY